MSKLTKKQIVCFVGTLPLGLQKAKISILITAIQVNLAQLFLGCMRAGSVIPANLDYFAKAFLHASMLLLAVIGNLITYLYIKLSWLLNLFGRLFKKS